MPPIGPVSGERIRIARIEPTASATETERPSQNGTGATGSFKRMLDLTQLGHTRFLILSFTRSGSSLLALQSHPHGRASSGLSALEEMQFNIRGCDNVSPRLLRLRGEDPVRFIDEVAFTPPRGRERAIGFKLLAGVRGTAGKSQVSGLRSGNRL